LTTPRLTVWRLLVFIALAGAAVFSGSGSWASASTGAAEATTTEIAQSSHLFSYAGDNPCNGSSRQMTIDQQAIFQVGRSAASATGSRYWSTMAQSGTFSLASANPGQPAYTGSFHVSAGQAGERHTGSVALAVELVGSGSDGSPFRAWLFEHVRLTDKGFDLAFTSDSFSADELACG
jgi:hypothetical protein